MKNRGMD